MRLIIARCEVTYSGRVPATRLPEAVRLIMIKADDTVMIWSDGGGHDRSQGALVAQDRPVCRGGAAEGLDVERVGEFDQALGERRWVLLGGGGRAGVHRLEPVEGLDEAPVRVVDACAVEANDHVLDEREGNIRAGTGALLELVDDVGEPVEPLRGQSVLDVDRRRGRVVYGLEQGFFLGAPVVRQSP